MSGLPHYKNAHAAMEKWEPVYLNLFDVLVTPPAAISEWQYVIDNVKKIDGLDVEKVPAAVEQIYKGAKRRFSAALPESTTVDVKIEFEVNLNDNNSMYVFNALRQWTDLCWDPLTGAMTLKKDYTGGPMTITLYNRVGDVTRQWVFPVIFPITGNESMALDYSSGSNIYATSITFAADYWDDMRV